MIIWKCCRTGRCIRDHGRTSRNKVQFEKQKEKPAASAAGFLKDNTKPSQGLVYGVGKARHLQVINAGSMVQVNTNHQLTAYGACKYQGCNLTAQTCLDGGDISFNLINSIVKVNS